MELDMVDTKEAMEESITFDHLPDELMVYLFSFVPEATCMKEILNKLAQLAEISKRFKAIAEDGGVFAEIAKRHCQLHRKDAEREFLGAANIVLSQEYPAKDRELASKIVIALAGGISTETKNIKLPEFAKRGYKDIVQVLLVKKADVNSINNDGHTALILAAESGHYEAVQLLLAHNADVNEADKFGYTALIVASTHGHKDIVKLLIARGADVNASSKVGNTALIRAAKNGNTEIVKLLIHYGAFIDTVDMDGNTALIWAARNNHKEVVEFLVAHNANVNATNNYGNTAFIWASMNNHELIVELLNMHSM